MLTQRRRLVASLGPWLLLVVLSSACAGVVPPTRAPMGPPITPGDSHAPSTDPRVTPTGSPAMTPSAAPSATPGPTASGTPSPTAGASDAASPSPSPAPSGRSTGTFLEVIADDMSRPRSGFQTGDFEHHRVAYEGGELVVEVKSPGRSTWTMRTFGDWPLVDVEGRIARRDALGGGFHGLTCGRSNDDFYAGLLDGSGGAVLLRVVGGQATVLRRDLGPAPGAVGAGPLDVSLSCGGTDAGEPASVTLSVAGEPVSSAIDPTGFASFLRAGFYLESASAEGGATLTADDFRVVVGLVAPGAPGAAPSPSGTGDPAVDTLLLHVPETIRPLCREVTPTLPGAVVAVDCASAPVSVAEYLAYTDPAAMEADYADLVAVHPGSTGGSCHNGPGEGPYTVDGLEVGRVLCALDGGSAAIYWTDERVGILARSRWVDDQFADLYGWWLQAGPLP